MITNVNMLLTAISSTDDGTRNSLHMRGLSGAMTFACNYLGE
jgi:hypothetical protein